MLLSFPPVAISPRGYLSLGATIQTQETKLECPDMLCSSEKPLSGLGEKHKEMLVINLEMILRSLSVTSQRFAAEV